MELLIKNVYFQGFEHFEEIRGAMIIFEKKMRGGKDLFYTNYPNPAYPVNFDRSRYPVNFDRSLRGHAKSMFSLAPMSHFVRFLA